MIGLMGTQDIVSQDEDTVPHGDSRPLFAASGRQGAEAGAQDRVLAPSDRVRGDDQAGAEPARALAGLAAFALARADVVAGSQARPTGQMRRRGELLHVRTDFRQQVLRGAAPNTWDGIQE